VTIPHLPDLSPAPAGLFLSTDGFQAYAPAIRDAFTNRVAHGQIVKTYSVTHLTKAAAGRYSPGSRFPPSRPILAKCPRTVTPSGLK
jgi:hypothetical protein